MFINVLCVPRVQTLGTQYHRVHAPVRHNNVQCIYWVTRLLFVLRVHRRPLRSLSSAHGNSARPYAYTLFVGGVRGSREAIFFFQSPAAAAVAVAVATATTTARSFYSGVWQYIRRRRPTILLRPSGQKHVSRYSSYSAVALREHRKQVKRHFPTLSDIG